MPSLSFPTVIGSSVKTIVKTVSHRVTHHPSKDNNETSTTSSDEGPDVNETNTYAKGQARHEFGYDVGWALIKNFIEQSTHHTVEELQDFVTHSVPSPPWIKKIRVTIPSPYCLEAAKILVQADPSLIKSVGGSTWWQWAGHDHGIHAEWLAPKTIWKGFPNDEPETQEPDVPTMFTIHGGGFFFGSVDTHRYQFWRMARKANSRAFTVAYRLAPQYPFPCALMDCLAAYLYLTEPIQSTDPSIAPLHKPISPKKIIISGDSAGGNLALSLLCVLRNLGKELPAGGVLISPWVDLTHSFESVMENADKDILPPHGFIYQPSEAWPPSSSPPSSSEPLNSTVHSVSKNPVNLDPTNHPSVPAAAPRIETPEFEASQPIEDPYNGYRQRNVCIRGNELSEKEDQIQLYATNDQLNNPLVSPLYQTSLGGLCPLLMIASDHECLRDEVIYLAHRAAQPERYQLSARMKERNQIDRHDVEVNWKPTLVHLQVYNSTCHMFSVMGWTDPAKYCYRSMASFCRLVIDLNKGKESNVDEDKANQTIRKGQTEDPESVFTGSYLGDKAFKRPEFQSNMVRERVDVEGNTRVLEDAEQIPCLQKKDALEGYVPEQVIERFLEGKKREPRSKRKSRIIEKIQEYKLKRNPERNLAMVEELVAKLKINETPPPTAMAGRIETKEGHQLALEVQKQLSDGLFFFDSSF
ncbi:hypothetical protein CROQUDRAFT_651624 [Cronartium quercuum f. sp. fusiforme G11]|uniref:Alpha/beta hydrolase fold-3 domain-containing protein n=1 Tax=Cronartium quercuum f. sp. fusiforme G11 TaxID=708437 RepID=A0A9P6NVJ4_9BASI|nr:hypothetical protein CROQUDRAFT_651624 [Cronartium quercuum f. sp. fusiforme G11]